MEQPVKFYEYQDRRYETTAYQLSGILNAALHDMIREGMSASDVLEELIVFGYGAHMGYLKRRTTMDEEKMYQDLLKSMRKK